MRISGFLLLAWGWGAFIGHTLPSTFHPDLESVRRGLAIEPMRPIQVQSKAQSQAMARLSISLILKSQRQRSLPRSRSLSSPLGSVAPSCPSSCWSGLPKSISFGCSAMHAPYGRPNGTTHRWLIRFDFHTLSQTAAAGTAEQVVVGFKQGVEQRSTGTCRILLLRCGHPGRRRRGRSLA